MKARSRAFTLAETVVGFGIFLLLLGFFIPIMRICWKAWKHGDHLQTAQRDTLALSYRLRRDYTSAKPESLAILRTGPNVLISFVSYESVQGTETMWNDAGEIVWRKWVQYFFDASQHTVRRRELALSAPSTEPNEPPPIWDPDKTLKVASHVTLFQAQSNSLDVKLVVKILTEEEEASSATQISVLPSVYALDTVGY
ncbi:hypothetical protein JST97_13015 [bacterium]|nr:hypothetical protein [bacterium]